MSKSFSKHIRTARSEQGLFPLSQFLPSLAEKTPVHEALLRAGQHIFEMPDPSPEDKAFLTKYLVQVTLPHSNPGSVPAFRRTNGDVTLTVQPALDAKLKPLYPYGSIPRLLLYWITTEALRQQSRKLELSESINGFLRDIGLNPATGGGQRGDARRLRDQMHRLFRARISLDAMLQNGARSGATWHDMQVAPKGVTWWDFKHPEQGTLFESWIELGEDFYNAIVTDPVPVDLRAVAALKRSPLALDLYAWATYETFRAARRSKPRTVPWRGLMRQIGAEYSDYDNFRKAAKNALKRVRVVFPGLRLEEVPSGLIVHPGRPAVLSHS